MINTTYRGKVTPIYFAHCHPQISFLSDYQINRWNCFTFQQIFRICGAVNFELFSITGHSSAVWYGNWIKEAPLSIQFYLKNKIVANLQK